MIDIVSEISADPACSCSEFRYKKTVFLPFSRRLNYPHVGPVSRSSMQTNHDLSAGGVGFHVKLEKHRFPGDEGNLIEMQNIVGFRGQGLLKVFYLKRKRGISTMFLFSVNFCLKGVAVAVSVPGCIFSFLSTTMWRNCSLSSKAAP